MHVLDRFRIDNKVAIITGGAGLLGRKHAETIVEAGGIAVLWDINGEAVNSAADTLNRPGMTKCIANQVDITDREAIQKSLNQILETFDHIDILINNAANDPKVAPGQSMAAFRFENLSVDIWQKDMAVGLTGAFLCSQVIGSHMAAHDGGVILNIASDLGVIAPDQRIYKKPGLTDEEQPAKPVTYSVIKHGIIGLTKYLATYWADKNIRVNAISPGGVYTNQPDEFVKKLTNLIPMGKMAGEDEYKAAVLFLISEASSYMTGTNLVIDGGRTCW